MQTASAPAHRAVPLAIRDRLARLLGMVGSAHDGEALNAARLADKLLRQTGATWFEILADAALDSAALQLCDQCEASLGDRERSFVQSLAAYRRRPSPRQLAWLRSITERLIEAVGGR